MTERYLRKKKVILIVAAAFLAGIAASFVMIRFDFYLPCLFRSLTGFLCPGCGATRMFLSLLQLDFEAAFHYNGMLLISLPFILFILIQMAVSYVRKGTMRVPEYSERLAVLLAVLFIVFGIARNFIQPY